MGGSTLLLLLKDGATVGGFTFDPCAPRQRPMEAALAARQAVGVEVGLRTHVGATAAFRKRQEALPVARKRADRAAAAARRRKDVC